MCRFSTPLWSSIAMKVVSAAWIVFGAGLLVSPAVHARPQTGQKAILKAEVYADARDGEPRYRVTNISSKTVNAWAMEFSFSSRNKVDSEMIWDALLQSEAPLEPGASSSHYMSRVAGGPLPDKAEVLAGVWDDGETFGQPDWAKRILESRAKMESEYAQAVAMLKLGLEENWNCDQYLQALNRKPTSIATLAIRPALSANPKLMEKPEYLRHQVQARLDFFTVKLEQLRRARRGARDGNG
jgi:hypothetical protein